MIVLSQNLIFKRNPKYEGPTSIVCCWSALNHRSFPQDEMNRGNTTQVPMRQ